MSSYNDIKKGKYDLLQTIFENGKFVNETSLSEIRAKLND